MAKVWLVTGASSGLGRAVAGAVQARGRAGQGDIVVATARDTAAIADDFADVLRVDVRDQATVDAAVEHTIRTHGRVDVLVNSAGHGLVGAVEELSDSDLRQVLDVNLLGAVRMTRAVLPHMRDQRSGHMVQLSSVGGVVGNPGHAAYAASKFALEGLSEALAGEVAPWGIRVTIVEPGPFRTAFAGRSIHYADRLDAYAQTPAGRLRERFADQDGHQPGDPDKAARAILAAVDDPASPLRLPLGSAAVDRIRAKLPAQLDDLASCEATARGAEY